MISTEIQRLQNAKADLKTAIESKGVTVSSSAKLDDYADLVDSISTGGGDSGWQRPADWPNLSVLDRTEEVLYLTYPNDEEYGFCFFSCTGAYSVAIGHIENGFYVVDVADQNYASNATCKLFFGTSNGGYKVIRVKPSGGHLTKFNGYTGNYFEKLDGHPIGTNVQRILEVYGNMPYCTSFSVQQQPWVESVDVLNIKPTTLASAFYSCSSLVSVNTSTWDTSNCSSLNKFASGCSTLKYIDLDGLCTSACTSLESVFADCNKLKRGDFSSWDASNVTTFLGAFSYMRSLESIKFPANFVTSKATNLNQMFRGSNMLKNVDMSDWDTSNVTNFSQMFEYCSALTNGDISMFDMTKATSAQASIFASTRCLEQIYPSSLKAINGNSFGNYVCYLRFRSATPPTFSGNMPNFGVSNYGGLKGIYVPYSADHSILNAYKTATNWSNVANYIYEEEA